MNTVRSCFTATVAFLAVAISWSATDAVVCCDRTYSDFCHDKKWIYRRMETIGNATCHHREKTRAWPVWSCCQPNKLYDPELRLCNIPTEVDGDKFRWMMLQRLLDEFKVVADSMLVGYYYYLPNCDSTQVLVDVPVVEVRALMEADPSAVELPQDYCFALTPFDELVAQTCRPLDQYCGRGNYTCVNRCCRTGSIFVYSDKGLNCEYDYNILPTDIPVYETDADGRPMGQSNRTVVHQLVKLPNNSNVEILNEEFKLTTDGSLYHTKKNLLVMNTRYCVEYVEIEGLPTSLFGFIWDDDTESPAITEDKRGSWMYLFRQASYVTSVVCLALTLLVYAKLSYLRNVHGYYVMCYMACELVWFVCEIIRKMKIYDDILNNRPLGILFSYFNLFAILTTCCWLNVICFDIYWMLRYNNSINRNTSTSVRTILYHIYCWGFSSICISTGYLFNHSKYKKLLEISPYIGDFLCYFYDCTYLRNIIFLILCMSVMQTANMILFIRTAIHFSRIKSELNKFNSTDSKTKSFLDYKEKFVMNIKLFLIMGMPRSSEIIPFLFQKKNIILDIFDATGSLQGVFVLIIFLAKSKVIMELRKMFKRSMDHSESTIINTISGPS